MSIIVCPKCSRKHSVDPAKLPSVRVVFARCKACSHRFPVQSAQLRAQQGGLQPGAVLCFSHSPGAPPESVEVVVRREIKGSDCPRVCCFCRTGGGNGVLVVTSNVDRLPTIEWFANGRSFDLHPDDIEVFQRAE